METKSLSILEVLFCWVPYPCGKPRLCLSAFGCNELCRSRTLAIRYVGSKKDHSRKIFEIKSNQVKVYAICVFPISLIRLGISGGGDSVPSYRLFL